MYDGTTKTSPAPCRVGKAKTIPRWTNAPVVVRIVQAETFAVESMSAACNKNQLRVTGEYRKRYKPEHFILWS